MATSVLTLMLAFAPFPQAGAAFAGNNGKLIFSSGEFEGPQEIFVSEADGTGRTRLTGDAGQDLNPTWSPDGTKFVYTHYGRGAGDLFIRNADGSGKIRVTRTRADESNASFSPGGTRLVYERCRLRRFDCDIYRIGIDGTGVTRLSSGRARDIQPVWSSPGGISFGRWRGASDTELFVMNANGFGLRRLTANRADDMSPSWAPGRATMVFQRCPWPRDCELYKINVNSGVERRLTDNSKHDLDPAWSPNGRRVAFARSGEEESPSDLFTMRADGQGTAARVTSTPARWEIQPDWQPLP